MLQFERLTLHTSRLLDCGQCLYTQYSESAIRYVFYIHDDMMYLVYDTFLVTVSDISLWVCISRLHWTVLDIYMWITCLWLLSVFLGPGELPNMAGSTSLCNCYKTVLHVPNLQHCTSLASGRRKVDITYWRVSYWSRWVVSITIRSGVQNCRRAL